MKNSSLLFLLLALFSCSEGDIEQLEPIEAQPYACEDVVRDASGRKYPDLDPSRIYCSQGWGRKMCRFLGKYDGTSWADSENHNSDSPDIKLSNFSGTPYFISFLNIDSSASYCKAWKLGETTIDGIKWNINIKRDEVDILWFDYEYYGSGTQIEYTITYKYEVRDGLLHFSSTDGQAFIFSPSESNYSIDSLDTDQMMLFEGCMFF